ncbi:MAG: cell division ATP-binding protein FtsE [Xanthomonadales bacterium]|nr:cell division ATP-binding protein FtsE [Xanthomonadales bacterium]
MIRFDTVTMRYAGSREALRELSFEMAAGEMVFLTGHSGAGKSTLLKLVAGLEKATRGTVLFDGANLGRLNRRTLPFHRRQVGMIFQDHRLLHDRSIFDNVALPLLIAGVRRQHLRKRVRGALDRVGLLPRERAFPLDLSGGEQQRVGIARAVVNKPPMLLADEPTGNLDPDLSFEIMQLFADLNSSGLTVLVASHDLHLVRHMKKRALVLEQGRLIDDFRPSAGAV